MVTREVKVKKQSANGIKPLDKKPLRERRLFPFFGLEASLVIARAIAENNACKPYSRPSLAESIGKSPESSTFRYLLTSSSSYGLTEGSYVAPQIKLSNLGLSIVAPKSDEERRASLIRAAFNINLYKRLYEHFDQHKLPAHENLKNTLIRDFGVDPKQAADCIKHFLADGQFVGLIRRVAGADRVSIRDTTDSLVANEAEIDSAEGVDDPTTTLDSISLATPSTVPVVASKQRVFITHGSNKQIVSQLKEILTFGKFVPVVAEEHETLSKPVPDKVLDDMQSCFAGIIHVAGEEELLDRSGTVHHKINENVLIEIGVALALYKRNFILLVQKGVHLPSNLQGLYRCDYEGDRLDYEATMKLLKAFNDFQ